MVAILYGTLRGRIDRHKREDCASTPHLQIRVLDDTGQPWRIAVNVQSEDQRGSVGYRSWRSRARWTASRRLATPSLR
jgi:hypothetical protein